MNLREYGREGNLETSAPSLTGIFYMQGEEYSMKKSGVLGLAVLLALAGGTAHAAGVYELEGVVVTATKIEESTEKVPASISVVTAKEIKDRGYQSVAQALGQEPGGLPVACSKWRDFPSRFRIQRYPCPGRWTACQFRLERFCRLDDDPRGKYKED